MTTVHDKRIIVTGGAKGLGFALIQELLEKGARNVSILDCDATRGVKSVVELNERFGDNKAFFFPCDISKSDDFETTFKVAVEKMGGLDIVVNNAAVLKDAEWSLTVDVNVKGVMQGTLLAIETMGKHNGGDGGVVLNVSSLAGISIIKFFPVYLGSKFAVVGFSRSVSESFDKTGVSVKVICPDLVQTDMMSELEEKTLDFIDLDELAEAMTTFTAQTPEDVAVTMLREIEEAPNGAVWYQIYGEPPQEVIMPSLESTLSPIL